MKLYIISFLILWSVIFHAGLVEGSRQAKDVVVVSAKRVESEVQRTAENVRVYDEEYIHSLPARDLGEILKYIPGVDVKVVNQFSQATSLSIQGSESRHVLLMVDGIPFNTQLSGQANPVRIPIENIKQIEVIKGASSSAWGSSLGGVINVITKDTGSEGPVHGRFSTAYTEFSTTFNGLQLSGGNEHSGYYAAGSFFETDGIRDGAQAEASKFFVKGKTRVFDQMDLIASFGHSDLDVNDIIPDPFFGRMDIHQPTVATYGQLNADMEYDLLKIQAALKYNKQIIKTNTTFLDFGGVKTSISGLDSYVGLSLNASYPFFEEDLLVVGADVEKQTFKVSSQIATAETLRKQAPYANYTMTRGQWDVIPGVRYDNNETFGSQVSPSLGIVYHFDDEQNSRFRFKTSRVFNAPPLLWVHQETSTTLPNPELEPETGVAYEAGFNTNPMPRMNVDVNVFWMDIKDAIATVRVGSKSRKDNFDSFRRRGAEVLFNYELNDQWNVYSSAAFNDVRDKANEDIVRDQGIARQSFGWGIQYHTGHGWVVHLTGYYNRWSSPSNLQANDRKPIFDLKMSKRFITDNDHIETEVFLNVYNLTNSKYWSSISFPLPERYVEGGMNVYF